MFGGTTGLIELVKVNTSLEEVDISGCLLVSDNTLYTLQENLLHMREDSSCTPFSITLGGRWVWLFLVVLDTRIVAVGTGISGHVAMKFASATGASVCLHDLSSMLLQQPHFDFGE